MNVYIHTDIEGTSGFVFFDNRKNDTQEGFFHRKRMRDLQTGEVNAAVKAAFDAGAENVLINDNHGSGYNILFEELDPRCEVIHGRSGSSSRWLPDLSESFDALVLIGMHAKGGTKGANLCHTNWLVWQGADAPSLPPTHELSEASMTAALAGDLGIPTVFVSGDDYICAEVLDHVPNIETAIVKKALGTYISRSKCPEKAREMIYDGVLSGLKRRDEIKPLIVSGPCSVNLSESKEGNHDQRNGYQCNKPNAKGATISEAYTNSLNQYEWRCGHVLLPDGFEYP